MMHLRHAGRVDIDREVFDGLPRARLREGDGLPNLAERRVVDLLMLVGSETRIAR